MIFPGSQNDRDRAAEARDELHRMLNEDELRDAILLVFANKQVSPTSHLALADSHIYLSMYHHRKPRVGICLHRGTRIRLCGYP